MNFHDIPQNTEIWGDMRMGLLTGSPIDKVMASSRDYVVVGAEKSSFCIANMKTKKTLAKRYANKIDADAALQVMKNKHPLMSFGEPAKQLAVKLAIEQITGKRTESGFSNAHMDRGHAQEPIAAMLYENTYFCDVTNGGFFEDGKTGCSPDGLVDDDGVIEIKSVIASVHYETIKRNSVDPAYRWQVDFNLKTTGRDWLDFISYCADYPVDNQLFVHRIHKADRVEQFKMIDIRVGQFMELLDETKGRINNGLR